MTLQELLGMKRQLLTIRRLVAPQREMLGRLARRDLPFIEERTSHYFRDVYDHVARMEETTMVLTDLASGALEAQLKALHPYEVPEWIVLDADAGDAYGAWLADSVSPPA